MTEPTGELHELTWFSGLVNMFLMNMAFFLLFSIALSYGEGLSFHRFLFLNNKS